jgi:NAD(P)-dependent dehydrogenase (short-subunit alcohol dehydrogenase family)
MRLKDKVAIVTGGGSGIGKATAILFSQEGAKVIVADYSTEAGTKTAEEIRAMGFEGMFVKTDVSSESDIVSLMETAFLKYNKLDILFNCAGVSGSVIEPENLSEAEWDQVTDTNLKGVFLCTKNVIPFMRKSGGGSIVNAGSVLGYVASPSSLAYSASKGGLIMVTKNFAVAYAKENIRINAICPGYIKTPLLEVLDEITITTLEGMIPINRLGEPAEIARCVVFLVSEDASYITGACLIADGGYTCQ